MIKFKNKNPEFSLHLLIWLVLFFLPAAFSYGSEIDWGNIFKHFWLQLIFLAVVFYINYLFLVHWLFGEKRISFFIINAILLAALIYLKGEIFVLFDSDRPKMLGKKPPEWMRFFMDFLIYLIPIAFSVSINAMKKMRKAEEMKIEADNIKLQSELQHLKYQLQPHFFFNALNNIYSLVDFAPEKAKQSIHSLSKLMRHLLQKSDVEKISLAEEIDFLNKYIDLMSLRLNESTKVYTNFPTKVNNIYIVPLLFISIVENAFKHGVSATKPSDICFKLEVIEKSIFFTTSNSNFPKNEDDRSGSGIGVDNLRKRLQLLYPNKHEFNTYLNNGMYIVEMKLETE